MFKNEIYLDNMEKINAKIGVLHFERENSGDNISVIVAGEENVLKPKDSWQTFDLYAELTISTTQDLLDFTELDL